MSKVIFLLAVAEATAAAGGESPAWRIMTTCFGTAGAFGELRWIRFLIDAPMKNSRRTIGSRDRRTIISARTVRCCSRAKRPPAPMLHWGWLLEELVQHRGHARAPPPKTSPLTLYRKAAELRFCDAKRRRWALIAVGLQPRSRGDSQDEVETLMRSPIYVAAAALAALVAAEPAGAMPIGQMTPAVGPTNVERA
ncbi:hypothetical protein ACVW1B_001739 [Bradyrhizobium sp. USDA 4502]